MIVASLAFILFSLAGCAIPAQLTGVPIRPNSYGTSEAMKQGNLEYANSNWDQAIIEYTKAIELDPKLTAAYHNRGGIGVRVFPDAQSLVAALVRVNVSKKWMWVYGDAHEARSDSIIILRIIV